MKPYKKTRRELEEKRAELEARYQKFIESENRLRTMAEAACEPKTESKENAEAIPVDSAYFLSENVIGVPIGFEGCAPPMSKAKIKRKLDAARESFLGKAPKVAIALRKTDVPVIESVASVTKIDKPPKMTALDAAYKVLTDAGDALTAQKIAAIAFDKGLWTTKGKAPEPTIHGVISRAISKGDPRFVRAGRGVFATASGQASVKTEPPIIDKPKLGMDITEKFRPQKLSDVAAQKTAVSQIQRILDSRGAAASAWWLTGATGTGKTTIARILADDFAGNSCAYEFVGRELTVETIKNLDEKIGQPLLTGGRAIIINEAQDLSTAVVALLLATVEKVKLSKFDTIIFTSMIDVTELDKERAAHFRALATRCYQPELADIESPVFQSDVVEFVSGVAIQERIMATDIELLCKKAGWSIRAALATLDLRERVGTSA